MDHDLIGVGNLTQRAAGCPGCPPGLRPVLVLSDGLPSPSVDSGLEELREFAFSCACSSATRNMQPVVVGTKLDQFTLHNRNWRSQFRVARLTTREFSQVNRYTKPRHDGQTVTTSVRLQHILEAPDQSPSAKNPQTIVNDLRHSHRSLVLWHRHITEVR